MTELAGTIRIDLAEECVEVGDGDDVRRLPFASPEAFEVLSTVWLRLGWDTKYVYGFSWMGRPIIQLPEDLVRMQEVVYQLRPDVIIETGIAHGGSLAFYASLCKAIGRGRVIGVDIEIRPHNRRAIEAHELFGYMELIEGSSTDPRVVEQVRAQVQPGETVLVSLDSRHSKEHVLAELEAYSPLVSVGSYIVATDGIMADVVGAPRSEPDWTWNNPREAAAEFVRSNAHFVIEPPPRSFNEGSIGKEVSYWTGGWLRRTS